MSQSSQYQLTAVSTNGVVVEAYGYDPLGRRAYTATGGVTNWHAYVGMHCVADLDAEGNVLRSYTYGPGVDNLLAMTVHGATETNTYYAITDHLGTVHALADASGAIVESYRYDAWGNVLAVYDKSRLPIPDSRFSNRFLFQCREYSWATRLYNFRARWYDPATGRWLSNDPIGISGGLNQYVFCGNDPVNYVDPEGLSFWSSFRRGFVRGVLGAAAVVGGAVAAVTLGIPAAVVTGTLAIMGGVGGIVTVASAIVDPSADNLGHISGAICGGAIVGGLSGRLLANRLSPPGHKPPPGREAWSLSRDRSQVWRPNPGQGFVKNWSDAMATGPNCPGAAGSVGCAGTGLALLPIDYEK